MSWIIAFAAKKQPWNYLFFSTPGMVLIHHGWRQNQRDIRGWYFTISFCYIRGCKLLWKTFEERTWFAAVNGCRCRWPFTVDRRPNTSRTPFFHFTFVNILLTDFLLPFLLLLRFTSASSRALPLQFTDIWLLVLLQWCNHVSIFWRKISFSLMVYCIFYGSKGGSHDLFPLLLTPLVGFLPTNQPWNGWMKSSNCTYYYVAIELRTLGHF